MRYISTRGGMTPLPFCDILLGGLAPDGGLTLPESMPQVSGAQLKAWQGLSYAQLAHAVIGLFATDVPSSHLQAMVERAYTAEIFGNGENSAEITPLKQLDPTLALLALSNGPTLAFKDVAMQFLGQAFPYVLKARGENLNILGATSGDTGSAAEYAMRGAAGVRVFMLSPHGRMSAFQRAQMYSLQDPNIFNIAVDGVFDDCQDMVKAVSNDLSFKATQRIGAVNSINWGRIVAQVVYYFKGYLASVKTIGDPLDVTVPSGNFGNICAGHIARMMGLPLRRLVLATNENDVLDEFFSRGVYRVRKSAETHQTSSPSMDISKASNFERFLFELLGRDGARVKGLMADVETKGGFDLSADAAFKQVGTRYGFVSGRSTHAERLKTIRHAHQTYTTLIDPHTADALNVALKLRDPAVPMLVLETALPAKFEETMIEAMGSAPPRPAGFEGIEKLPLRVTRMGTDVAALKEFIARETGL